MFTYKAFFFDFKKAFDTVNHTILPDRLHHHGIGGILHKWFSSYFANRTQTTHIDNDHGCLPFTRNHPDENFPINGKRISIRKERKKRVVNHQPFGKRIFEPPMSYCSG